MDVQPFGKYLLDREIARGGMARVWLARLRGLGGFEKRLVVKQILPHLARDPRFVSMFVEEAKTLVQMSHPHLAPVFELGVVDGIYFLAMEYVEGATLSDILDASPLPAPQAAHVGVQVADALAYAHERFDIVHRDVTPRNVMVDGAGHCRLLDFGIAAPASTEGEEGNGELFGTPGYLSPEQARGERIGPRSDVFSLGAVLYHALVGIAPHDPNDLEEVRALGKESRGARLPSDAAPAELIAIIEQALEPDEDKRHESARAMGRALRGWLAAHEPEGVLAELGARAEKARSARDSRRASERPPAISSPGRRDPSGKIETLAASRALEEILDGTAPIPRASKPPQIEPPALIGDEASPGPSTVPIARRAAQVEAPLVEEAPATQPEAQVDENAWRDGKASPPWWMFVGAVAALALVAVAMASLSSGIFRQESGDPGPDAGLSAAISAQDAGAPIDAGHDGGPIDAAADPSDAGHDAGASAGSSETTPPRARATLSITTNTVARVTVDGRDVGYSPVRNLGVTPGWHQIVAVSAPLGWSASMPVRVGASETLTVHLDLERPAAP